MKEILRGNWQDIQKSLVNQCFKQEKRQKKRKIVQNIDCNFMQKRVL